MLKIDPAFSEISFNNKLDMQMVAYRKRISEVPYCQVKFGA